ncbi:DNase I-like protein [Neoconidiobolus thromboides FSU 785]|nr:DNase I-like protein [Neoconidiobolus thromboides FSU 785]
MRNNKVVIASFNIRSFSIKKLVDDKQIRDIIIEILNRYDVIFLQEVRESDAKSMDGSKILALLLELLKNKYEGSISVNLGRNVHKEKYIYLYKKDLFTLLQSEVFIDTQDLFERDPFILRLQLKKDMFKSILLLGIHVKPSEVQNELDALVAPFEQLSIQPKPRDNSSPSKQEEGLFKKVLNFIFSCLCPSMTNSHQQQGDIAMEEGQVNHTVIGPILLGDLNAGSSFISKKRLGQLALFNGEQFHWLIENDHDTTVNDNHCALDRIIVPTSQKGLFSNAKAYRFDDAFKLDKEFALKVSDHYPVEVEVTV